MSEVQRAAVDTSSFVVDILSGKQRVISYETSLEYGPGGIGTSACGLAALNCARFFFRLYEDETEGGCRESLIRAALRPETMEEIVSICSVWPVSQHLEVEELLCLPLFKNVFTLVKVQYSSSTLSDFHGLLNERTTTSNSERNPISAFVITRPPEILVCLKICSTVEFDLVTAPRDMFIVFNSQSRPAHPSGSAFIMSSSASEIATYLDQLFALDAKVLSQDHTIKWQAELLKQFSAHVLVPAKLPSDSYNVQAIVMDASMMILQMKAKVAEMEAKQAYLTAQNKEMHARIVDLEELHVSSDVKGKRKEIALYDDENSILDRKHDELSVTHASFQCKICLDHFFLDDIVQFPDCTHSFCRTCLRGHVSCVLEQRRYPILCPGCVVDISRSDPTEFHGEMLKNLGLSESDSVILQELQLSVHSIALHCRKCKETMFVDRSEYQSTDTIVCPLPMCNNVWCKDCQQTIDVGGPQHSCDGSTELQDLMARRGWRHCPGCRTPIQKDAGCNHMTCLSPGCNTHFCYVCGEQIIQALGQRDIRNAISAHYIHCRLF